MLTPITISKQSPFLGEECVLCKNPFAPGDEVIVCPEDSSRHHTHCWRAHGNKCASYGCQGHGEVEPEGNSAISSEPDNSATSQPATSNANGRLQQTARRFGCGQGCLLIGVAIAIIFFSIACFGLWAIADYIMLEVLGWQYRGLEAGYMITQLL